MRIRSNIVRLAVWFLVGPFVYFHTSCDCVNSEGSGTEPSLVACAISTIISWAGSIILFVFNLIICFANGMILSASEATAKPDLRASEHTSYFRCWKLSQSSYNFICGSFDGWNTVIWDLTNSKNLMVSGIRDSGCQLTCQIIYEPRREKTCFCHMRTTKAQISLRIRAVWSTPLLFAAQVV